MPHFDATTAEQVNSYINSHGGVAIIDCHATWCGPCKMIAPKAVSLSDSKDVVLIKVDVDQAEELAGKLGVSAMPTFFFVKGSVDNVVEKMVGANPAQLEKLFEKAVSQKA